MALFDTNNFWTTRSKTTTKTVKERLLLTHYCFLPKLRGGDQASEEREHNRRERDDGGILIYHRVDFPLKSKHELRGIFSCWQADWPTRFCLSCECFLNDWNTNVNMSTGIVNTGTNQGLKHRIFIRDIKVKRKDRNTIEKIEY